MKRSLMLMAVAVVVLAPTNPALAHGQEEVGGHSLSIGWLNEPTYVEQPNAVQLIARDASDRGIEGLASTVEVEVRFGDQTTGPMELTPAFGSPGEYHAHLIPTVPGRYTFHFTGTINGDALDVTMEAGEGTFDEVRETTDLQFPHELPSQGAQADKLERIDARLAALQDDVGDSGPTVQLVSYAALAVALVALALVLVGRRRT